MSQPSSDSPSPAGSPSLPVPASADDAGAAPLPPVAEPSVHDPYAALRLPNYRRYFIGNAFSLMGTQMTTYAVGYEIYLRTRSPFDLGLVGLVQVIPIILFALPSGYLIDRFSRKKLILLATAVQIILWVIMGFSSRFAQQFFPGLAAYSGFGDAHVPLMLGLLLLNGACRAINQPAKQALMPGLVPARQFPNAVTWNASLFELSNVLGPMVGGFALAAILERPPAIAEWAFTLIYWTQSLFQCVQWVNIAGIKLEHVPPQRETQTMSERLTSMFAGVRFVFANKVILGTITLDLFAVLLGGATALLPVFAAQILRVGPIGLAWLRAAPSIGAISMAMILAHMPPMKHAGRNLLWAVAGFGAAIILFGLSRYFWLSIIALIMTGFFDNVSVVVRQSLVQLLTPDHMRGRVSAVNSVFISTSNELGEFESGTTADIATRLIAPHWGHETALMWGPQLAVAAGGLGTLMVVGIVALTWPQVAAVTRLGVAKKK